MTHDTLPPSDNALWDGADLYVRTHLASALDFGDAIEFNSFLFSCKRPP